MSDEATPVDPRATVPSMETLQGRQPIRTIVPVRVGLGVAQFDGVLHAMLTVDDPDTGGTLDILVDKVLLGAILAHGDEVRRRIITAQEVPSVHHQYDGNR